MSVNPFKTEMLDPVKRICPMHGEYEASRMILPVVGARPIESGCPVCEAAEIKAEEVQTRNETNRSIGIPPICLDNTLETFITNGSAHLEEAKKIAQRFIDSCNMRRNVIFLGPTGTGKTHLAVSILKELPVDKRRYYTNIISILDEIKESYSKNRSFKDERTNTIRTRFSDVDYLVIDNFEEFSPTKDNQKTLFTLLNNRHNFMKPTIICSEDNDSKIRTLLGYKLYSKLNEVGKTYTIDPSMLL